MAHIDFAAHLEDVGNIAPAQFLGHVGNGAQIRGDVFAFRPVAPRGAEHEFAFLVAQAGGKPVDLGLRHQRQLFIRRKREKTAHARREIAHVLVGEGIVEREHGPRMAHLLETLGGFRAHALRGAVVADQFREAFFDFVVAQAQRIIFGVGDRRRVILVIAFVVRRDLLGQARQLAFGFRFAQLIRRTDLSPCSRASSLLRRILRLGFQDEATRRGPRFIGDGRARQHPRDLFDALLRRKLADAGGVLCPA